ncbi:MAG: hypothetical protein ACKVHO_10380 [Verrucomicrobiia bacterium]|jgi:hypothetical protein
MVHPEKDARIRERVSTLLAVGKFKPEIRHPSEKPRGKEESVAEPNSKPWWKKLFRGLFGD